MLPALVIYKQFTLKQGLPIFRLENYTTIIQKIDDATVNELLYLLKTIYTDLEQTNFALKPKNTSFHFL